MSIAEISLFSALFAGALSFLSPCVLPLVPPYLCYMAGISVDEFRGGGNEGGRQDARRSVLLAALFFTLGFSTVFVALGAGASTIGTMLRQHMDVLSKVGGVIIILMGLNFLGFLRIGLFSREARFQSSGKPATITGAYLMGLAFAFGWTPCIGPVLTSVLAFAAGSGDVARGTAMLVSYSVGLAVPFLAAALALDRLAGAFAVVKRHFFGITVTSAVVLAAFGVLLAFNRMSLVTTFTQSVLSSVGLGGLLGLG